MSLEAWRNISADDRAIVRGAVWLRSRADAAATHALCLFLVGSAACLVAVTILTANGHVCHAAKNISRQLGRADALVLETGEPVEIVIANARYERTMRRINMTAFPCDCFCWTKPRTCFVGNTPKRLAWPAAWAAAAALLWAGVLVCRTAKIETQYLALRDARPGLAALLGKTQSEIDDLDNGDRRLRDKTPKYTRRSRSY
jgi:hypothetical protein